MRAWSDKTSVVTHGTERDSIYPITAGTGVFYSLAGEVQNARGRTAQRGEIYRNGKGWWWPEPWGCWIRNQGPATLAFVVLDSDNAKIRLYLGVRGVQGHESIGVIQTSDGQRIKVPLLSDEERTITITLKPSPARERQIVLTFTSNVVADFRASTKGRDFRVCGLGVKWFYVCREDDIEARLAFVSTALMDEAIWSGFKKKEEKSLKTGTLPPVLMARYN
ncbi:MAG: hypothetical protein WDM89_10960 [Rhizomicrobium sp.]